MRLAVPVLCRRSSSNAAPQRSGNRCPKELCLLPASGTHPRRDALEFPLLAGLPLCCARPDGRQRSPSKTRLQRTGLCPGHRRDLRAGRFAERLICQPQHSELQSGSSHCRCAHSRGQPHGQRAGRQCSGSSSGKTHQKEPAGTRRQRPLSHFRGCRYWPCGKCLYGRTPSQCRTELHWSQALHRAGRRV